MSGKRTEAQIWLVDYLTERYSDRAEVIPEYRFCLTRKWRFDVGVRGVTLSLGFEIEGGLFMPGQGRHSRGAGMRNDIEKYNTATALGYRVFRFLPEQVLKGQAKEFIEKYL